MSRLNRKDQLTAGDLKTVLKGWNKFVRKLPQID